MTFEELLKASCNGLPEVKTFVAVNRATSNIGKVVALKDNGKFKGCAVQFPGLDYDIWFTDSNETDKRSRYMYHLAFTE